MTECRDGCGCCCDPVVLPFSRAELLSIPVGFWSEAGTLDAATRRWIAEDLSPMPYAEAKRKAPQLFGDRVTIAGDIMMFPNVFRCANFDEETRECRAYDRRPPTCVDYPFHNGGDTIHPAAALPAECEFRRDQGHEPVPIEITRKPR